MTAFALKVIASVCMLLDHIWEIFTLPVQFKFFKSIGRIAFPLFAYMIAQGWRRSKDTTKYMIRMGIFAIISEIPFDLAFYMDKGFLLGVNFIDNTNVFYTLFLGTVSIAVYEKYTKMYRSILMLAPLLIIPFSLLISLLLRQSLLILIIGFILYATVVLLLSIHLSKREGLEAISMIRKVLAVIIIIPIFILGNLLSTDYGMYGIIFIFLFYISKPENRISRTFVMTFIMFFLYAYPYIYFRVMDLYGINLFMPPGRMMYNIDNLTFFYYSLSAVVIILFYNNKKGFNAKWMFYTFYPVHICIAALIRHVISIN